MGQDLYNRGTEPPLSITTLPDLNANMWGLRPGALTVIGARTSQGKSSFAMQIAQDLADQHVPVWMLSLEMSVPNLIERLFCHMMRVDNYDILSGQMKLNVDIQRKYLKFKQLLEDSPLLITEGIGKSWEEVYQLIDAVKDKPQVIIIDYIQNIGFRSGDTREVINEYIRKFRNMAIKHGFAGVLCSQINRGAEQQKDNEPTLAQLKETGFLEESADVVLLLHWKSWEHGCKLASEFNVNIAKNRNGMCGSKKLWYTPKYYRFTEYEPPAEAPKEPLAPAVKTALATFGGSIVS